MKRTSIGSSSSPNSKGKIKEKTPNKRRSSRKVDLKKHTQSQKRYIFPSFIIMNQDYIYNY